MVTRKKLIEVSLPLDAINAAASREKSIRHGHPSTLHLWWARRPLAAARAVLFAQLVDDPSARPELFPDEESQGRERQRLFRIIEQLVRWENTTNEEVLEDAPPRDPRELAPHLRRTTATTPAPPTSSTPSACPPSTTRSPAAARSPWRPSASAWKRTPPTSTPVAVLINKAMIEIPAPVRRTRR